MEAERRVGRWSDYHTEDWVQDQQDQHICACGCGQPVTIKFEHKAHGIPKYIHGHNCNGSGNPSFKGVDEWVEAHQGKIICACGCGKPVLVRKHHHFVGIPTFIHGHNSRGEMNPNYKDGGKSEYDRRRNSNRIRLWRKEVWHRDHGRCQMPGCPNPETKDIQAHHIVPFIESEEVRFEIQNGITLCRFCHQSIKTREGEYEQLFQRLIEEK